VFDAVRLDVGVVADAPIATCHRDFHDKQILYDGDRSVLLDCDTLAMADPALDLGNFIAHLQWRTHQSPNHSDQLAQGTRAFRRAYGAMDDGTQKRAGWWSAATLLRLACLYTWRPRWRHAVPAVLRSRRLHRAAFTF